MARDPKMFQQRIDYAKKHLEENDVDYMICNYETGHINMYHNGKVVISFWTYTGKIYSRNYPTEMRGIHNVIKHYKKIKKGEL